MATSAVKPTMPIASGSGVAPVSESGCSAPRNFTIKSVDKVTTQAESGDITCETAYDLRTHQSEDLGGENPGTMYAEGGADVELCEKAGGSACQNDNGIPFLVRHGDEALVITDKGAVIVDKDGKVRSSLTADCLEGSMWFDKTRFACVVKNRVEVFSRETGATITKAPQPGPRLVRGAPPFSMNATPSSKCGCER